ncbi:MAG TPA: tetratricopeptide repeat protein [Terriglobales bacterium]|nr:tetratricopeptide repeat protein [Terriglobales bacterium]
MRAFKPILLTTILAIAASSALSQAPNRKTTPGATKAGQTTGKTVRKHRIAEESPIALAEAAIEKQDYATAEKLLRQVIAEKPTDFQAWFDLGFVLNATGNTQQAIDAYRKSVSANPNVFESNLNLGLLLAKTGSPDAEKHLRAATQLKPTTRQQDGWAHAWLSLGHVIEKTNPHGAIEAFRAAANFAPKDPEPHLSAGLVLEQQKQFNAAEAEYKAATALDPKSPEALAGLVNIYTQTGRMPEAEAALRKYIAVDPQNASAHIQLGRVLALLGKTEEAATELQTGLKLSPGNVDATRQLAALLIDTKKHAEAENLLRPLLQVSPNDASLHHELGRALLYGRKFAEAQQEFLAAIKLKPDLGEAYGDLAIAANEEKNYPLTIRALDERAKYLEESPATYFLRATAYDHLRNAKQAVENYRRFLQVANGKFPDQEWQARHRLIAIDPKN